MRELTRQKDGWFVPTTVLLDRLLIMKKVKLEVNEQGLILTNLNNISVPGITILVKANDVLYYPDGLKAKPNNDGEIIIGRVLPGESKVLFSDKKYLNLIREYPSFIEKINMFIQRAIVYLSHN